MTAELSSQFLLQTGTKTFRIGDKAEYLHHEIVIQAALGRQRR
jgi:hypothetical protein